MTLMGEIKKALRTAWRGGCKSQAASLEMSLSRFCLDSWSEGYAKLVRTLGPTESPSSKFTTSQLQVQSCRLSRGDIGVATQGYQTGIGPRPICGLAIWAAHHHRS